MTALDGPVVVPMFLQEAYDSLEGQEREQFERDYPGLPNNCPDWCVSGIGGHVHSLIEGNGLRESSQHRSEHVRANGDAACVEVSAVMENGGGGFLDLTVLDRLEKRYSHPQLTTGQARVLARQLLHAADLIDLTPPWQY